MVTNQLRNQEISTTNLPHFNSNTRHILPKKSTVVSSIMCRLNYHAIDNGDVEVHTSDYPFESTSDFFTDMDTTPIKLMDDD